MQSIFLSRTRFFFTFFSVEKCRHKQKLPLVDTEKIKLFGK